MSDIQNQLSQTVRYPSEALPAPPEFEIDLPADWEAGQVPGLVLAAGPSVWDGPFRSNIAISTGLVPRDAAAKDLAATYVEDFAPGTFEIVDLDQLDEDTAQLIITVQFQEPAIQVIQSVVVVKVDNRPAHSELVSLLTITASADTARSEVDGPLLHGIIDSLRISVPADA